MRLALVVSIVATVTALAVALIAGFDLALAATAAAVALLAGMASGGFGLAFLAPRLQRGAQEQGPRGRMRRAWPRRSPLPR